MADLHDAGMGTLAARVEFEGRDQLASLRQAASTEPAELYKPGI